MDYIFYEVTVICWYLIYKPNSDWLPALKAALGVWSMSYENIFNDDELRNLK